MEAEKYSLLVRALDQLPHPRKPKVRLSDKLILRVYFWGVVHDRSTTWATKPKNWPADVPHALPSESAMSRRMRSVSVLALLERLLAKLADSFPGPTLLKSIDSKPMLVGHCSGDRDARWGKLGRGKARGYRLHCVCRENTPIFWTICSMNEHDSSVAPALVRRLPPDGGYLVGDNAYDTNQLHQIATQYNYQLVSPPRKSNRGKRDIKKNCPQRLRALDMLDSPLCILRRHSNFGSSLYARRTDAERSMAALAMNGLSYLPPWVRGPRRVAAWTAGKIAITMIQKLARNRTLKQALMN